MSYRVSPFGGAYDASSLGGFAHAGSGGLASSGFASRSSSSSRFGSPAPDHHQHILNAQTSSTSQGSHLYGYGTTASSASVVSTPPRSQSLLGTTSVPTLWLYLDYSGTEQGPFDAATMSTWLSENYFQDFLPLRRQCDSEFLTLQELKYITDSDDPFAAPLSPEQWNYIMAAYSTQKSTLKNSLGQDNGSSVPAAATFANGSGPEDLEDNVLPAVQGLSTSMNALSIQKAANSQGPTLGASVGAAADTTTLAARLADTATTNGVGHVDSSISRLRETSSAVEQAKKDAAGSDLAANMATESKLKVTREAKEAKESREAKKKMKKVADPSFADANLQADARSKQKKKKKPQRVELSLSDPTEFNAEAAKLQPFPEATPEPESESETPEPEADAVLAPAPVPTPAWGKPAAAPVTASVNLRELQLREMQRKEKLLAELEAERVRSPGPAAGGWGAAALGLKPQSPAAAHPSGPGYSLHAPQKVLSPQTQPGAGPRLQTQPVPRPAVGSIATTSTTPLSEQISETSSEQASEDGFVQVRHGRGSAANSAAAKPQLPSSVSALNNSRVSAAQQQQRHHSTATPTAARPADLLVQWAKVTLQQGLRKGVDTTELVSVFLSLPLGPDAKEFIAESVYTYSTTLDGRRFAHEFIQRRGQVEQAAKSAIVWPEVLKRIDPKVETDPSFTVVTKKRR